MEVIYFWGTLILLGLIAEQISKWNKRRKERIRDEVAVELLADRDIIAEVKTYRDFLLSAGYDRGAQKHEELERYASYWERRRPKYYKLQKENCPECNEGHLIVRHGSHGSFFGCSRYPNCKFTSSVQALKREMSNRGQDAFMEIFNTVYH